MKSFRLPLAVRRRIGPATCLALALLSMLGGGCTAVRGFVEGTKAAFRGYYTPLKHFGTGTAREINVSYSVEKAVKNTKFLLKERDFSLGKSEATEERGQVRASRNGQQWVVDISSLGEGAKVHVECDTSGNDGEVQSIASQLESMP
jgi:hypothetical protein